ncbi:hypothetical protein [Streptomyces gardneri]
MSAPRRRLVGGLVALTVAAACGTALSPAPASAVAADAATYTVTVGTKGS